MNEGEKNPEVLPLRSRVNKIPPSEPHSKPLDDCLHWGGNHEYTAAQSHPGERRVNTKPNPSTKAEPGRFSFGVCVCVVGLALAGSRHGSNQVEACLPTEFKRQRKQTEREKDERN